MKTLMLLRHAKSDWSAPFKGDHDRQLNARGQKAAPLMGAFMRDSLFIPDEIMCSAATRTRQTCALLLPLLEKDINVSFSEQLYLADEAELLKHAVTASDASGTLLVIAHNPGIHALALGLISSVADGVRARDLEGNYPTGALSVITFDVDRWLDIAPHTGTLVCYQTPRPLTA